MAERDLDDLGDAYRRAGLLDPHAPGAEDQLRLLEWLRTCGFSLEEMREAQDRGDLGALPGDALSRAGVELSAQQIADETGLSLPLLAEVHRAAGLAPVPSDHPLYLADEVSVFDLVPLAQELFGLEEFLQFLRVVGSSMARISDAANALYLDQVEIPLREAGGTQSELAERGIRAIDLAIDLPKLLAMLLRLHLGQSLERSRRAREHIAADPPNAPMAVGFVDLVGFTPRAATMDGVHLAELVTRFEAMAHDAVVDHGGRLVKLIGDEVMYVAVEAATGCDIALALLDVFARDETLTPRGGLAYGGVLAHSGDFFGPIVNLASRLADAAVPGEVLATPEVANAADRWLEPAGRRMLKGFDTPIAVMSLTGTDASAGSGQPDQDTSA